MDGGYCFHHCLFVCLFVNSIYAKTPGRISTKLGGGIRYGPRIMPLDFGLGQKKKLRKCCNFFSKKIHFIWKIFEFFFFAFLHVLSDFQAKKNLLEKKKILQLFFQKNFDFIFLAFLHARRSSLVYSIEVQ